MTMTVKELISHLQQLPQDKQVFVRSYEEGYDPVDQVVLKTLEPDLSDNWYVGRFNSSEDSEAYAAFEGVVINGDQRSP